jgi:very-short-patch-repair endonuclease
MPRSSAIRSVEQARAGLGGGETRGPGALLSIVREESARQRADAAVAHIAASQHGVVSLTQLTAAGIDRNGIWRRLRAHSLYRIHRGVYAVGHAGLSQHGIWRAAVLACGPGAVLSHASAAALWKVIASPLSLTHVTVPGDGGRKRRQGIVVHRSATLLLSHTILWNSIPVTKPARTLEDLRRVSPPNEFAAALRQAEYLRLPLGDRREPDHTRSELEALFLRLCRRHRLPTPEVNVRVGPYTVDFLWREQRLVVEVDGYRTHGGRQAFEDDRARELDLGLLGLRVRRFSYAQVTRQADRVARSVRKALGA